MSVRGPWEKVGTVGIDAGYLRVGDPSYSWCEDFLPDLKKAGYPNVLARDDDILVTTGYGDGTYDVFVRRIPPPPGATRDRIAEVKVVFIPTDEPRS